MTTENAYSRIEDVFNYCSETTDALGMKDSVCSELDILKLVPQDQMPLLIATEDVEREAVAPVVVKKIRGGVKVAFFKD